MSSEKVAKVSASLRGAVVRLKNRGLWLLRLIAAKLPALLLKLLPPLLWASCITILATVLIAALAAFLGKMQPNEPSPWTAPQTHSGAGPWAAAMGAYVDVDDIPGAITVVKDLGNQPDRADALESLIRDIMLRRSDLEQSINETQQELDYKRLADKEKADETKSSKRPTVEEAIKTTEEIRKRLDKQKAQENAEKVKRLIPVHEYLDTIDEPTIRVATYALLTKAYTDLNDKPRAARTFDQLRADLKIVQKDAQEESWLRETWNRLCKWFRPFLHERIVVFLCGIMVAVVFVLRPTASIGSKALAYWFFGRFKGQSIRKALGEKMEDEPDKASRSDGG
jgi:hypothetical protein